jgi:hypothetical protein
MRDGRSFDHGALETICLMVVETDREVKRASSVISCFQATGREAFFSAFQRGDSAECEQR